MAVRFMTASACPAQLRGPSMNAKKRRALMSLLRGLQATHSIQVCHTACVCPTRQTLCSLMQCGISMQYTEVSCYEKRTESICN